MNNTGELVRHWRERRGMSQARLAELAGTGQAAISRIESGRGQPTLALLERIASALGCRLTLAFASSAEQPPSPS
ncbi:helix-turn-helix domain-containing protein [Streptomyces sp. NPDC060085]|uniref:helix-turn-helix domain-containing protein n=1 Tax=Streptomyces sp. NPDC060085 TaxID=3347054 RepID=UPI003665DF82